MKRLLSAGVALAASMSISVAAAAPPHRLPIDRFTNVRVLDPYAYG